MDWTLERVNVPQSFTVLGNDQSSLSCGRSAENNIICSSLVVSRRHCLFIRTNNQLCVIDLKSSNGVYVNNKLIQSDKLVELNENDCIGIGCDELYKDNEPMFVYKLHKGNLKSRNLANFANLLTQRSEPPALTTSTSAVESIVKNDLKESETKLTSIGNEARLANKRNLLSKNNVDDGDPAAPPPPKIIRIEEKEKQLTVSDDNAKVLEDNVRKKVEFSSKKVKNFGKNVEEEEKEKEKEKDKKKEEEEEGEDIQEVWSTIPSPKSVRNETIVAPTTSEAIKKSLQDKRSDRLTLDLKKNVQEEEEKEKEEDNVKNDKKNDTVKNGTKKETKSKLTIKKDLFKNDAEEKNHIDTKKTTENKKQDRRGKVSDARKDEKKEIANGRAEKTPEIEKLTKPMKIDNRQTTLRLSVDSSSSATRITLDLVNPNKSKDKMDDENDEENESVEKTAGSENKSRKKSTNDEDNDDDDDYPIEKTSKANNNNNNDDNNLKKIDNKIDNRISFFDKIPAATSSPFKLKIVKQEPTTSFSVIDTVDLSDDDDHIFPSSQLFDSTTMITPTTAMNGDVVKIEDDIEVKEENIFDDYHQRNDDNEGEIEKEPEDHITDDCNDIIVLSESEDEENPWLIRLSQSQRIKEEKEEKVLEDHNNSVRAEEETPEMEFFDEMIRVKEDLTNLSFGDLDESIFPTSSKTSTSTSTLTKKADEKSRRSSSSKPLSNLEIERAINDDEPDGEEEKDSDDSTDAKVAAAAAAARASTSSTIDDPRSPSAVNKKMPQQQSTLNKGPKIIEPLYLPQKKRRSLEERISSGDLANGANSSRNIKDCVIRVSKLPNNLTTKEKRLLQSEGRRKEKEYEDQQRLRRVKNKWAQKIPLPLGKKQSLPITKKQKLEIVNERKEKLKALAQKRHQDAEQGPSNVERVAAKPKAKVSVKSRSDFLIDDCLQKKIDAITKTSNNKTATTTTTMMGNKETKESLPINSIEDVNLDSKKLSEIEKNTKKNINNNNNNKVSKQTKDKGVEDEKTKEKINSTTRFATANPTPKTTKTMRRTISTDSSNDDSKTVETRLKEMSLTHKDNRVSSSLIDKVSKKNEKGKENKVKKKVTFRDDLTTVREFQIEPNNTLEKCVGKDALFPKDKLAPTRKVINREGNPKIEEFLIHVFQWNPSWLEEQKHLKTEPPVVGNDALVPLLTNYKSYKDYYQVMTPLFLLELWHVITKEFENIDNRSETLFCSVVVNSVTSNKIPNSNTSLTTMMLEIVASEDDIKKQKHPINGDLVFLELCFSEKEKLKYLRVFAYVTYVHRSPITPHTFFNRDLMNYVKKPSYVLTYTILTKLLKVKCCENRMLRVRRVTSLRSNLRTIQALQSLPRSPLMNVTIDPKIEEYQLSQPKNMTQSSLITGDKLNGKQLEAVFKITETIVKKEPKICLVQGPPGTGKSHVIVNMVMQTLYGDNRYKSRETAGLRILLCAPSNAAIDEIVIRLLDRRAKLQADRFKMVRVGISNSMHSRVRDISVEELAKRELKRVTEGYQSMLGKSTESVEEEKRYLEAKIKSLQSELTSTQNKDDVQDQYLKSKLSDTKARYDLIKNCLQSPANQIDAQDVAKLQRGVESKLLVHADIIACTLSSCYNNMMETLFGGSENNISVCIVDEATQSSEAETLIPLMLGVNTLVLVGDPAQLPATIISQRAKKLGLDQSLFSRIDRAFEGDKKSPVIMLDVQYRMKPSISYWPNQYFYRGKLRNGHQNRNRTNFPFRSYNVVNCIDSVQNSDKFSNTSEAEFVVNLIQGMINHVQNDKIFDNTTIGVITPYRKQQILVQDKINERVLPILKNLKWKLDIQVNTIDSFQGHERDIIIMSCVRTNGIGFMSDRQRLCVALTRAKSCFVLCGNYATFQRDAMWSAFLTDAQSRKRYIKIRTDAKPKEIISHLLVKST